MSISYLKFAFIYLLLTLITRLYWVLCYLLIVVTHVCNEVCGVAGDTTHPARAVGTAAGPAAAGVRCAAQREVGAREARHRRQGATRAPPGGGN